MSVAKLMEFGQEMAQKYSAAELKRMLDSEENDEQKFIIAWALEEATLG